MPMTGRTWVQAFSTWLLIAEGRIRSQGSPCETCGESGTGTGSLPPLLHICSCIAWVCQRRQFSRDTVSPHRKNISSEFEFSAIDKVFWSLSSAVPWLRQLDAGLSLRRPGFALGLFHLGFVMDKVALGQVLLRVFRFPLPISFHRGSKHTYIPSGYEK
jgi:hypothetical protein